MKRALSVFVFALLTPACGTDKPQEAPCNTLSEVRFVKRCDDLTAQCALLSTAPAGAVASGCALTLVNASTGAPEPVTCETECP